MGLRIRDARLQLGMMLEEFAAMLELTPGYLANIERGKRSPSLNTLVEMAERMEVSIDYLVRGVQEEENGRNLVLRSDEELNSAYMDALEALLNEAAGGSNPEAREEACG